MSKQEEIFRPLIISDQSLLLDTCVACLGSHYIRRIWEESDLQNKLLSMSTDFKTLSPTIELIK